MRRADRVTSVLNVRSARTVRAEDLTARARIRAAAVERFARDGFGAGVRVIAEDAGVSPALVLHHFGSKQALRQECDEVVLTTIAEHKAQTLGPARAEQLLVELAQLEEHAPLVGYVLRSVQQGGGLARAFVESFVEDTRAYLEDGVAAGTVRPSRDEAARARWLTMSSLGALLAELALEPVDDPRDLGRALSRHVDRVALPALELFTEGLLVDRQMLDAYLMYMTDPPAPDHAVPPHPS